VDVLGTTPNASGANTAVTGIVGGAGIGTFTKKQSIQYHGGFSTAFVDLERWWAVAAAPLSAKDITATFSATLDSASMIAFAVSGADTTTPFDVNANASKQAFDTTSSAVSVAGQSTTNPNTMLISSYGSSHNTSETGSTFGGVAGSTPGGFINPLGNVNFATLFDSVLVVSSAQSSITDTYTPNNPQGWASLVDAIQAAGGAAPKSFIGWRNPLRIIKPTRRF